MTCILLYLFIIYLRLPSLPFPPSCHLCHLFPGYPHCHVRPGVRWGPVSLAGLASRGRCRWHALLLSAGGSTAAQTHSGPDRPLPSMPTSSALRTHRKFHRTSNMTHKHRWRDSSTTVKPSLTRRAFSSCCFFTDRQNKCSYWTLSRCLFVSQRGQMWGQAVGLRLWPLMQLWSDREMWNKPHCLTSKRSGLPKNIPKLWHNIQRTFFQGNITVERLTRQKHRTLAQAACRPGPADPFRHLQLHAFTACLCPVGLQPISLSSRVDLWNRRSCFFSERHTVGYTCAAASTCVSCLRTINNFCRRSWHVVSLGRASV